MARALHPDRETDARERDRKTALMQRAKQAYEKNNLLQLLELQLELQHIDQRGIDNISRDRLTHYNKVLKDQLGELELEIARVEAQFRMQFNISPFADVSPGTIVHRLGRDIAELESAIRELERDLLAFEDLGKLKACVSNPELWIWAVRPSEVRA